MRATTLLVTLVGAALLARCEGGGSTSPPSSPPSSPQPVNPCSGVAFEVDTPALQPLPAAPSWKGRVVDGDPRWRVLDSLWSHRGAVDRGLIGPPPALPITADLGEIAVLQDEGDLVLRPNTLDLRDTGLRFTPNAGGGYDAQRIDGAFRQTLGDRLALGDDDSVEAALPFAFPFYGQSHVVAHVNSDGNVTFDEPDAASTERNLTRLLTGPPRAAPFLADLDPSAGGAVFARAAAGELTVTWCNVRGFESQRMATVQVSLLPDGSVEMKVADSTNLANAIVGLSPGRTGNLTQVDLSAQGPTPGGQGAVAERFAQGGQLDTVAVVRKFYATHPDLYDQLVIWLDTILTRDAFAYEVTVANEIRGIGVDLYDLSRDFGSAGRLRSLAVMDWLGKYPDDPAQKFLGENSTVSVLGQEVGHRWLAFLRFLDHNRRPSDALLGRGRAHWSFFMDTDASVMEGNDIEDLGGGSFRTVAAVERFSQLDQYAMGLLAEHEVPPFFYVESPLNVTPFQNYDADPRVGVTFNGTRRDTLIQDVVAVMGPRIPPAGESPRVHRQAFLYVVGAGREARVDQVEKLDRIRVAWTAFFLRATDGRMRVETRLRPPA